MSVSSGPPPVKFKTPSPEQTLRKLYLALFLRGRSSRGLTKEKAPQSIASKLWLALGLYALVGCSMLLLAGQSVMVLSISLHAMTFLMLGMFIASSSGEALFNKDESEILMHRPVTSQMLLRAKASVLIEVSLYLAAAMNAAGMIAGVFTSNGGWLFPFAHAISTVEEALFTTGVVVLTYQLCLKWFGRERLESVMTTMQVVMMVSFTVGSQILPRMIKFGSGFGVLTLNAWWMKIIPATWFASLDDAIAGSRSGTSWMLASVGLIATGLLLWLAFGMLSEVYESGWQSLNESTKPKPRQQSQFRFISALSGSAPMRLVLRDPVSRVSFQLVSAYLFRDRDTKLRLYPGVAPMMVMPIMLLVTSNSFRSPVGGASAFSGFSSFTVALSAVYMCILPLTALNLIRFSQQWRATEVFIAAPIAGPAPLLQGARVAVMLFLGLPLVLALCAYVLFTGHYSFLWLVLAGLIAMPVYAMIPGVMENATPLSNPIEEAKSTSNFPVMMLSMFGSFLVAGAATAAAAMGFLAYFLILEAAVAIFLCFVMQKIVARRGWRVCD